MPSTSPVGVSDQVHASISETEVLLSEVVRLIAIHRLCDIHTICMLHPPFMPTITVPFFGSSQLLFACLLLSQLLLRARLRDEVLAGAFKTLGAAPEQLRRDRVRARPGAARHNMSLPVASIVGNDIVEYSNSN